MLKILTPVAPRLPRDVSIILLDEDMRPAYDFYGFHLSLWRSEIRLRPDSSSEGEAISEELSWTVMLETNCIDGAGGWMAFWVLTVIYAVSYFLLCRMLKRWILG